MPHAPYARALRRSASSALAAVVLTTPLGAQIASQNPTPTAVHPVLSAESWQRPPQAIAEAVGAPREKNVTLTNASPDRRYFLRQQSDGMPTMAQFARPHVYLGGLQVDPKANRARSLSTRGAAGLSVISAETGQIKNLEVPNGATATNAQWSPDGKSVAFFANFDNATHIYIADVLSGRSRALTRTPVLATLNTGFEWSTDGQSIMAVLVPDNRPPVPTEPAVPTTPKVRMTTPEKNSQRTYPSLLETPYDMILLEYYTTGQLAQIGVSSRNVKKIGKPAMIRSVDAGPRGEYLRVTTMTRPFSYIVPTSSFGSREELWGPDGKVLMRVNDRPLNDGTPPDTTNRASRDSERRSITWRPDGEGLSFLQMEPAPPRRSNDTTTAAADSSAATPGGRSGAPRRKDRLMLLRAPYDTTKAEVVYSSDARLATVEYSPDGSIIFVTEGGAAGGAAGAAPAAGRAGGAGAATTQNAIYLSEPGKKYPVAHRPSGDDAFFKDPGTLLTKPGPVTGQVVQLSADGAHVFLRGTQYFEKPAEQAPRMFIDKVDIKTGAKQRIYEGENGTITERVVAVLDDDATKVIVTRESPSLVADSYLRDSAGKMTKLTNNRDYTPAVTQAQRRRVEVTRADGFKFKVDVTLPQDWKPGNKLPAMFWFYPSEFADQTAYDRTLRTYNRNAYKNLGVRSMDFLVLEGYAVVEPDAPITGASGRMNDNYENDLRNSLAATIDELEKQGMIDRNRLAVGGHSYGAFSTVNAMVHTPFFKAGIAGDGNYNRTLTPMTFQSERRDIWEARETYLNMSPLLYANNLTGALLMYHGLADQNVGTDPINSIRLFQALEGLGKNAALYMYPYEDHGPATQETIMDLWARWVGWLDTYVKNPKSTKKDPKIVSE
ncbi:MAG: prolyl oligopeptidase family serine peptidase [Longimicrobiales bacterium]